MQRYSWGGGGCGGGIGGFTEKSWRRKIMRAGQWEGMTVREGRGPSTVLLRDFAAKMNVSAEKHKAERQRPS